ncbi:threonine aldolase family protein [Marinicella litoralis]|uniref:L-threonine aldolase n=1 Tax=Marinicella litoralis TaxID=644220 RepID=A0A4R6XSP4_9GAMM|nr:beta-eliminating lyase-related protein [Marinicella litoralis]TDR19358.1 L-threonine aldolase [Marinicella litoralis]
MKSMRYLGMRHHSHQYWLNIMNQSAYKELANDNYNQGPLVAALENRVAHLLDKPKAMLFNKGTTCQLAALKTICQASKNNRVILHAKSHIAFDEQDAYQALMGLEGVILGTEAAPFTARDLKSIKHKAAVLTVELPLRRVGFKLTAWEELLKMRQWCDEHQVHFHMDGARLWESTHFYQRSLAEIAALFDSAYVSLYKGIGGISGALLVGSETFIAQCSVWRDRLGSNMYSTFPALITGLEGIDKNLPKIPSWVDRAQEINTLLNSIEAIKVNQADTNGFQLHVKGNKTQLNQQLNQLQQQYNLVLCKPFENMDNQDLLYTEIQVGAEHEKISNEEILAFFNQLFS